MQEYKKIPQLPLGLGVQSNILVPDNTTGKNWVVVDGEEYRKRPGWRPVLAQPAPDATAGTYTTSLLPPRGVLAAAEYITDNATRQVSYEQLTSATDSMYIYNTTQLVFICDGRTFSIRKVPVLIIAGGTYSYRYGTNSTTGALEFGLRNLTTGAETVTTVTESTTLADLANTTLLDTTYTKSWSTSLMPGLGGLPASCIVKTEGGQWLNLDPTNNFIHGYVTFNIPMSRPATDNSIPYRCFYTRDVGAIDGNVISVPYGESLIFAGRGDALMSFDGYRMSVAGCTIPQSFTTVAAAFGAAALSAGTYKYIIRPKTTKPSGQITYGEPVSFTVTGVLLNDKITITPGSTNNDLLWLAGSSYSGDIARAPRRYNILTGSTLTATSFDLSDVDLYGVMPQVGERVYSQGASDGTGIDFTNAFPITGVSGHTFSTGYDMTVYLARSAIMSLGEEYEVYRTAANGTAYYLAGRTPAGFTSYVDTLSDANLTVSASYVAKPYSIARPPDKCAAVTTHQNRLVVVGEYVSSGNTPERNSRLFTRNVYWTQPNNEEFSPTNNALLDVTEGGELNSVVSTGDALYVGGGDSMWVFQGALSGVASTFTINRIAGAGGTVGNSAVCTANGQVFAVSRVGLYTLQGGAANYAIGASINSLVRLVKPELLPFTRLTTQKKTGGLILTLPGMVFERPAVKLASGAEVMPGSFVATENATDTVVLVYDPNTEKWCLWSGPEMYAGGGFVEFDGMTWVFPRKQGKPIAVLDSGYGYDGYTTPVEMQIKGPWQTDNDLFTDKNFSKLRVICAAPGRQNFVLTTKIERNWNENQAWQTADIGFRDGEGYGQLPYGNYPYGDPNEFAHQLPLTNQKALSVRAVFKNSDPAEFPSITGWNFEVGENRKNMKQE